MPKASPDASSFTLYRRLLKYALPYKWVFLAAVVGMIFVSAGEASFAALLKPVMDKGFVARDAEVIRWLPIVLILVVILRGLGEFVDTYCMHWVGRRVVFDLRQLMFERLLRFPARYYDENASATLVSKLIYDVEQVARASTTALRVFIRDSVTSLLLLGWMLYLNWKMTLMILLLVPLGLWIVHNASHRFRRAARFIQESVGDIAHVAKEAFQGQRVVKTYNGYDYESGQFRKVNDRNRQQVMKRATVLATSVPLTTIVSGAGIALVIWYAMSRRGEGAVTAGDFVSYLGALILLMQPIKRMARVNEIIQTGLAAARTVFDTLDQALEDDSGEVVVDRVRGDIEFDNVSFRYPVSGEQALDNVSFHAPAGTTTALVGVSGSGKTTVTTLLLHFYHATSGQIRIDGVPIESLRLDSLRGNISIVSQDILLFDDTIRHNIAYGARGEPDPERVIEAAQAAHVLEFAIEFPEKLETRVGEHGSRLSGGQRQRVAIGRALYENAPILVFDEATSSLDSRSEQHIQDAIRNLLAGRTTLIVAHRLSTIEHADQILVFDRGRIVERGAHADLLALDGYYAGLHQAQRSRERAGDAEEVFPADAP
ncbi:MAG: lipid A export permease/ATP-binding protein MsbA [Pseudomonadota bacterium]|nr:lipid A export permease/ATP-binding protein MsbA [Pseudomonadota bacterium]